MAKDFIMSEANNDDKTTVTVEEFNALKDSMTALKTTNERILSEHKADKVKFKDRLSGFEEKDRLAAEASNDHKSLYEQSLTRITELESDLTETKYNSFEKNLTLEVGKLCKDAHNPLQVMRALKVTKENTDLANGTLIDLSVQIDGLRKNESNLFAVEQSTQTTSIPRYMKTQGGGDKPVSEMSASELRATLKASVAKQDCKQAKG